MGIGLSRPLRRVLARTRQCLLGGHRGGTRMSTTSWRFAAQGVVSHDRHRGGRRGDRRADRLLPAGPCRLSRGSGAVGRHLCAGRHAFAQLPWICGGAGRLHGRDRRRQHARRDRRPGCAGLPAIYRASEVCIGIVCAGIALAGTDLGGAQRRLAALFAALSAEVTGLFAGTLALAEPGLPETLPVRRALIRRVIALDPIIDEAIGESSQLRYHSPVLQTAVDGLFAALAGWRTVAVPPCPTTGRSRPGRGSGRPVQRSAGAALRAGARRADPLAGRPGPPAPDL